MIAALILVGQAEAVQLVGPSPAALAQTGATVLDTRSTGPFLRAWPSAGGAPSRRRAARDRGSRWPAAAASPTAPVQPARASSRACAATRPWPRGPAISGCRRRTGRRRPAAPRRSRNRAWSDDTASGSSPRHRRSRRRKRGRARSLRRAWALLGRLDTGPEAEGAARGCFGTETRPARRGRGGPRRRRKWSSWW